MNYDTIPFGYLISLTENQLSGISNPIYAKGFTIHENNNPEAPVSINFETNDDGSIILTKVSPGSDTSSKCLVDDLPLSGQVQLQHGSTIDTHIGKFLFHYVKLSTFNPEHPDYVKVKKNISPNKLSKLNSGGKENIASVKKKTWSTIVNDNKKPVVKKIENIIKKNVFKPSKRSIGSKLMSDAKTPTAVKRLKNLYTTGHCDSPETIIIKKPKEELRKIAMKRDNQFAASTSPFVSKGRKREKNFTPSNKKKVSDSNAYSPPHMRWRNVLCPALLDNVAKDCIAFNILQVKPDSPALPSRLVGAGNSSKLASGRTPRRQLTDEVGQQSSSKAGQEGGDEVGEEGDLPRETSMEEVAASSSNPSEKDALVQRLWADDEDQQLAVNEIAQVSEAACANPSNISTEQINEAEQPNDIVEQKLPLEIKGVQIKNKKNLYSDIVKQNKLKSSLPKRPAIVTPSKNLNNFIVKQSKLKLTLPKAHAIIKPSKKHSKLDCNKGIVQSASMVQAFKNIYSTGHISSPSTIVINKSKAPMRKLNSSENEISGILGSNPDQEQKLGQSDPDFNLINRPVQNSKQSFVDVLDSYADQNLQLDSNLIDKQNHNFTQVSSTVNDVVLDHSRRFPDFGDVHKLHALRRVAENTIFGNKHHPLTPSLIRRLPSSSTSFADDQRDNICTANPHSASCFELSDNNLSLDDRDGDMHCPKDVDDDDDDGDGDINRQDLNNGDVNVEDVNEGDVNHQNVDDGDVNDKDVIDEYVNDGDDNHQNVDDDVINDKDGNDGDDNHQNVDDDVINDKDANDGNVNHQNVDDGKVNHQNVGDGDVNDKDVKDEDVYDGYDNDKDINDENIDDGDVNHQNVNDGYVNHQNVNDGDIDDIDVNHRNVNNEDVNNEDVDDGDVNHQNVNDGYVNHQNVDDVDVDDGDDGDVNDKDITDENIDDGDVNHQNVVDGKVNHQNVDDGDANDEDDGDVNDKDVDDGDINHQNANDKDVNHEVEDVDDVDEDVDDVDEDVDDVDKDVDDVDEDVDDVDVSNGHVNPENVDDGDVNNDEDVNYVPDSIEKLVRTVKSSHYPCENRLPIIESISEDDEYVAKTIPDTASVTNPENELNVSVDDHSINKEDVNIDQEFKLTDNNKMEDFVCEKNEAAISDNDEVLVMVNAQGKKSLSRNSLALKMPKANANCQARSSPRRLAFQNSLISIPKDDVIQLNSGSKKQELSLEHDIIPESPMITKLFESSKNDSIPESPMISKLFQDHNVSETLIVSDNVASPKGPTTMSSPAESEMKTKLCENVSSEEEDIPKLSEIVENLVESTRDVRILRSSPRKAAKKINKKIVSLEKAITDSLPDSPMITKLFEDNKPANESLSNEIPKKADISENAKLSKLFKNVVKSNEVRNLRSSPRRNANKKNNLHDTDSIPESPMIAKLFENIEIPEKENENTVKSTSRKIYKTQKKIVQKVTADNLPNSPMITKLFEDHKLVNEYITNEASKEENEVKDLRSSTRRKDNKKNDLIVTENEVKDLRSNRRKANKKNDLIVTENEVKDLRSNKRKDNKKNDLIVTENEVKDLRSTRRKANKKNDLLVTDSIQESPIIAKIFENIEIPEKENENKVKSTSRKRVQKANETSLRSSSRNIKVDNSLPKTIEDKEVEETFDTTSANFNSTSEIKLNKASIVSDKVSSPIKKKTNKKRAPKINVKNSAKKLDKNTKEDVIEKPVVDIVDEVVTCEIEILEPEKEVKLRRNGRKKATNNTIVKQLEPQVSGRTRSAKMISEDNAEISLPAKKTRVKKNKSADKITSDETDLPPKKRRLNNIIDNENVCNSDDKSETNESKKVTEELQVSCIRKTRSTKNIKEEESDPVNEIKPMKNTRARSKNKPEGKPQKKTTKSKDKIEQVVVRMTRSKQKDIDTSTKRITRIRV